MLKKRFFTQLLNFAVIAAFVAGCEKQYLPNDGYNAETVEIDAKETKTVHFFASSHNFVIAPGTLAAMDKLLKDTNGRGIDNIGFMLISNQPIPIDSQKRVKEQVYQMMHKRGFMKSRISDLGICVYRDADPGVRIDVLKYEITEPNCEPWSEYVGDLDTNKHLPRHGSSNAYNLGEMISNKADLVAPREYKGQETNAAIASSGASGGSSGGGK
jgi:type IV pilus biogenesis protein CpaD/CtpE